MEINKKTLFVIADVCNYSSSCMTDLRNLLPLLNVDNTERNAIEDAIITLDNKISDIKSSKVSDLSEHIDESIKNIETNSRF